jgi:hypothetical protein
MAEFASNGKGNLGVTLGAIGTGLGVLNGGLGNLGGLGGIFGNAGAAMCGGSTFVNRYEAEQQARIAELETEVKLRDANFFTMGEMGKLRDYVDHRLNHIEGEIGNQRVYNATNTAAISCIQGQIAQLMSLTKVVVPNSSICPGWGEVNVTVAPATTTAGA